MPSQPMNETLLYEMSFIVSEIEAIKDITINEYNKCLTLWYYDWINAREHYDMHELHDYLKKRDGIFLRTTNNIKIVIKYDGKDYFHPVIFKIISEKETQKNPKLKSQTKTSQNSNSSNQQRSSQNNFVRNLDSTKVINRATNTR